MSNYSTYITWSLSVECKINWSKCWIMWYYLHDHVYQILNNLDIIVCYQMDIYLYFIWHIIVKMKYCDEVSINLAFEWYFVKLIYSIRTFNIQLDYFIRFHKKNILSSVEGWLLVSWSYPYIYVYLCVCV